MTLHQGRDPNCGSGNNMKKMRFLLPILFAWLCLTTTSSHGESLSINGAEVASSPEAHIICRTAQKSQFSDFEKQVIKTGYDMKAVLSGLKCKIDREEEFSPLCPVLWGILTQRGAPKTFLSMLLRSKNLGNQFNERADWLVSQIWTEDENGNIFDLMDTLWDSRKSFPENQNELIDFQHLMCKALSRIENFDMNSINKHCRI